MPLVPQWQDLALRLFLTFVASAAVGLNRREHGRAAGLRTTILVGLAAAASMIQANLLLATVGKAHDSFIKLDLMRLPLGVLSGMGFIGGGAILKRGDLVLGVTTAATLWFVTIMGLCFGGGQIQLGIALLLLALVVLWLLKKVEQVLPQERQATFLLITESDHPSEAELRQQFKAEGFDMTNSGIGYSKAEAKRKLSCQIKWKCRPTEARRPKFLDALKDLPQVLSVEWRPISNLGTID